LIKESGVSPQYVERHVFIAEKFDFILLVIIFALVAIITAVILRGDQVGLGVRTFSPIDTAPSLVAITVTFDEPIDTKVAAKYFTIDPFVQGRFSVSGTQITFRPTLPLQSDKTYTVTLSSGFAGVSGRAIKHDLRWTFRVRQPRVVYLGPVDQAMQNLFAVDPGTTNTPEQITRSENGIVGYDVTPDGSKVVYSEITYSENRSYGVTNIFVMDVATRQTRLLYACNAACTNLAWRPDGGAVAFQRVDLDQSVGTGPTAPRVWLFDLATNAAQPLFSDNQMLGYSPRWSPDGTRLAVYSASAGGILVHDFLSDKNTKIPTANGGFGSFSPDGRWLYYPKIVMLGDNSAAVHYVLVDLSTTPFTLHNLIPDTEPISEVQAVWQADSRGLLVVQHPAVNGPAEDSGLYSIDLATGKSKLLVQGDNSDLDSLALSPTGDAIAFQRISQANNAAHPQLWLYNFPMGTLKMIADNATLPGWLP
jgi:Tol biopolymer transport system component